MVGDDGNGTSSSTPNIPTTQTVTEERPNLLNGKFKIIIKIKSCTH